MHFAGYTFLAESSTPRLRAKTAGFAAGGTCFVGLIFNYCVPIMLANPGANWGPKIGFFWAGLTSIALAIVYFTIPEVKFSFALIYALWMKTDAGSDQEPHL